MKYDHCRNCRDEVIWWAFFVNIGQTTYKGILGVISGSAALVADAMHSGADVVATLVTITSVKISSRKPSDDYPYGYGNIQFISSSIVGLILIFGALFLMYESIYKIVDGDYAEPSMVALLGAAISIITNELMYRYQSCVGKENNSPAILANAWDNRSDAISSLAVLIGIALAVVGFPIFDAIAAIGVGVLVARIGIELNMDAIEGLMDSSVDMEILKPVYDMANSTPKVEGIHYLRGRNVGEDIHLELDIYVDSNLTVQEGDILSEMVKNKIFTEMTHVKDIVISITPVEVEEKRRWGVKERTVKLEGI